MKVILLQELKGKGGEGDVVDVAPGFANNYLLPQKVAILATKGNLKQLEQRKHNIAKREENRLADAGKIKETLDGALVKVEAKVGEEGQLFGSVTAQMIADALKAQQAAPVEGAEEIEALIAKRLEAKRAKNWAEADAIRDQLRAMGVEIKDGKDGTTWTRI